MELVRDLLEPSVRGQLLHAEGDALLLFVHREDDRSHRVTLLHDLRGVRDFLRPAHVADVEEAVDALFDLNEGAVRSEVPHRALDDRADRVVVVDEVPRVRLSLLHAERDLLLLVTDIQDDDLDLLVRVDELRGVVDAASP